MASDFIIGEELPALIERGVPLVPVLLRKCRHAAQHRALAGHDHHATGT